MSQFYTRSSSPPNSIPMLIPSPSVPSTPHMRQSSPRMDWSQIVTRYTCASCFDWATAGKKDNRSMKVSKRYSRSLDFKSSLSRMKMAYRKLRKASIWRRTARPSMRKCARPRGTQDDLGEVRSTLNMMPKMKVRRRWDRDLDRELLCHALIPVNDPSWTVDRRREPLQERQKRLLLVLHLLSLRSSKPGGVG